MLSSALSWQIFGFRNPGGILNQGGSGNDTIAHYTGFSLRTPFAVLLAMTLFPLPTKQLQPPSVPKSAGTAGVAKVMYAGAYESAGSIAERTFTAETASLTELGTVEVSASIQTLQLTGLSTVRAGSVFQGGVGNDSIFLGDQITTFDKVSVRGGTGSDVIGTFNSGGATTGILSNLSGGEIMVTVMTPSTSTFL